MDSTSRIAVPHAAWSVVRFQLGGAIRLALRSGIPVAAAVTVAFGLAPDPGAALATVAAAYADASAGSAVPWVLAAVSFALAAWAAPRIASGADGWIRHLPLSEASRCRAAVLALVAGQAPAWLAAWALWSIAWTDGSPADPLRLVLPIAVAIVCAILVLPARRRLLVVTFGLVGLAAVVACERTWALPFVALGWLAAAERVALPLGRSRRRLAPTRAEVGGAVAFSFRTAVRAVRGRVAVSWLLGVVPLAAAGAFVANNPNAAGTGAVRFGGVLAVTLALADLSERLAARRPPWAWSRTLPWSASQRVLLDALWLALAAIPLLAVVAVLDARAAAPVAAAVPLLAVVGAGAARTGRDARFGSWGPVVAFGAILGAWVGVHPAFAWTLPIVAVAAVPGAARREREARPSTWEARHHVVDGDPASWRGR